MTETRKVGSAEFRSRIEGIEGAMRLLLDTALTDEQASVVRACLGRATALLEMLERGDGVEVSRVSTGPLDVLIVEDNDINARIISRVVAKLGAEYRRAHHGEEALMVVDQKMPDVVLMDVNMPVMDGLEATRALRQSYGADLPIVALTSSSENDDREACFAVGMDKFLAKPFRTEDLAAVLDWVRVGAHRGQTTDARPFARVI